MPKITKVQYIERWDALPPVLREAMFSSTNGELIWRVGEEYHLKEEQIATIAGICGNIVMGFIHFEDLAKEIKTSVGIDERLAGAIAREIDRKVFSPLRSEIDKVYSPAGPAVEEIIRPEVKEEVKPPKVEITAEHKIDISELRVVGPEEKTEEPSLPPGLVEKVPEPEIASQEEVQPPHIGEVEPPKVEESPKIEEIKPIIIHEEAEIKTVREPARPFSLGSVFGFFKKKEAKTAEPPTTAEIEMEMPEEPTKVVDYDNLDVQSIEQPPVIQEQPPAPENLPIEEKPEKPAEETQDDVIDLSSFEKKE